MIHFTVATPQGVVAVAVPEGALHQKCFKQIPKRLQCGAVLKQFIGAEEFALIVAQTHPGIKRHLTLGAEVLPEGYRG